MSHAPFSLAQLMDEHAIDIYQLFEYFDESIYREDALLKLTKGFSTRESYKQTKNILVTLRKFEEGLRIFCQNTNLDALSSNLHAATDYDRQTNALRFLLLLKKFPDVLEELTTIK